MRTFEMTVFDAATQKNRQVSILIAAVGGSFDFTAQFVGEARVVASGTGVASTEADTLTIAQKVVRDAVTL